MSRLGLIRELRVGAKCRGIVLTFVSLPSLVSNGRLTELASRPQGKQVISPSDRQYIAGEGSDGGGGGLAVVECSWARLDEIPWRKIASPHERLCEPLCIYNVLIPG